MNWKKTKQNNQKHTQLFPDVCCNTVNCNGTERLLIRVYVCVTHTHAHTKTYHLIMSVCHHLSILRIMYITCQGSKSDVYFLRPLRIVGIVGSVRVCVYVLKKHDRNNVKTQNKTKIN